MNNQEYEQKKQECWDALRNELLKDEVQWQPVSRKEIVNFVFDRAYAFGKENETITQEEIEKAAKTYAAEVDKNVRDLYGIENPPASLTFGECAAESFREGVNFALSKQEKDADTVIQGWVARDENGRLCLYQNEPEREAYDFSSKGYWTDRTNQYIDFPPNLFPDLTWKSEPLEVEIIIKRKKK